MSLLARRLPVPFQDLVDDFFYRAESRFLSLHLLRSGGIAFAIACRTIRRCTPCFFASPWIVSPAAYPRRISSNISTFCLLSISGIVSFPSTGWANLRDQSGPI